MLADAIKQRIRAGQEGKSPEIQAIMKQFHDRLVPAEMEAKGLCVMHQGKRGPGRLGQAILNAFEDAMRRGETSIRMNGEMFLNAALPGRDANDERDLHKLLKQLYFGVTPPSEFTICFRHMKQRIIDEGFKVEEHSDDERSCDVDWIRIYV